MKILSIEIISNSAGMVFLEGDKEGYTVDRFGKLLSIPKDSNEINDILEFQTNFSMFLQNENIDLITLCEGGSDSKKRRVRMEFAVLSECEKQNIPYQTYASGACTRLINSKYEKETGNVFADDLASFGVPKYLKKTLIAGWRFLK